MSTKFENICKVCGYKTTHFLTYTYMGFDKYDDYGDNTTLFECNNCRTMIKVHKDYFDKSSSLWKKIIGFDCGFKQWQSNSRPKIKALISYKKVNENTEPKKRTKKLRGKFR